MYRYLYFDVSFIAKLYFKYVLTQCVFNFIEWEGCLKI